MAIKITTVEQAQAAGAYDKANGAGSYAASNGGSTPAPAPSNAPTDRINGISQKAGIPNADGTPFDPTKVAPSNIQPGQPVDTTQPSPKPTNIAPTIGANAPIATYEQANTNLQAGGLKGQDLANASQSLKQKYGIALGNAQASGSEAPQGTGAGSAAAQGYTPSPPPEPQVNPIDSALKDDPGYQQLLADHTAHQTSLNQRDTLTQEYQKLSDSLGLASLNTQLMDMKKVIDGTEDDIRTEVTKAGGFATDSQVLAMSSARNKVMIQNYNNLLQTKQDAQTQLTTLIGLSEKDREQADQQFNQQMQYDQKVSDYRDKAVNNAKDAYSKIISAPGYGYQALFKSTGGDPSTISLVENTLGLKPGMLKQLSTVENTQGNTHVQLSDGRDVMIDKSGNIIKTIGGARSTDTSPGGSSGVIGPTGIPIPSTLTPYLNTSS